MAAERMQLVQIRTSSLEHNRRSLRLTNTLGSRITIPSELLPAWSMCGFLLEGRIYAALTFGSSGQSVSAQRLPHWSIATGISVPCPALSSERGGSDPFPSSSKPCNELSQEAQVAAWQDKLEALQCRESARVFTKNDYRRILKGGSFINYLHKPKSPLLKVHGDEGQLVWNRCMSLFLGSMRGRGVQEHYAWLATKRRPGTSRAIMQCDILDNLLLSAEQCKRRHLLIATGSSVDAKKCSINKFKFGNFGHSCTCDAPGSGIDWVGCS